MSPYTALLTAAVTIDIFGIENLLHSYATAIWSSIWTLLEATAIGAFMIAIGCRLRQEAAMWYETTAIGSTIWTLWRLPVALTLLFVGSATLHEAGALHLEMTVGARILAGVLCSSVIGTCIVQVFYGYDAICESTLPEAEAMPRPQAA